MPARQRADTRSPCDDLELFASGFRNGVSVSTGYRYKNKVSQEERKSILTGKGIRNDSTKEVNNDLGIVKMET